MFYEHATGSRLTLLKSSQFRGTAILAVGPAGILPACKRAKATGKMPIFPTAKMAVPRRLARFSTKLSHVYFFTAHVNRVRTHIPKPISKLAVIFDRKDGEIG